MRRLYFLFATLLALALVFPGCSSAPRKQESSQKAVLTAADSAVVKMAIEKKKPALPPQNLDVAHESFIRAQEMELRGEKQLAEVFWQRAYDADPGSRYLAFAVAQRLHARGDDSLALVLGKKAVQLKGKKNSDQFALMAKLYVKDGVADSARKYFNVALDSSHYQDMPLLYDYSLFLEAIQDKKELVRIYDLLLPQVNFISTLFQRQVNLLLDLGRDSAVVELFGKAHDATGDKNYLSKMVQGLVLQKRYVEARKIADTLTTSTVEDENIINYVLLIDGEWNRLEALKFLKKKVLNDGLRSPVMLHYLGNYEFFEGENDSAKVHLLESSAKMEGKPVWKAQDFRALSSISFAEKKKVEAVRFAEMADSVLSGGDKDFLALTYGNAGMFEKSYGLLDSLMAILSNWTPMAGVADSETVVSMKAKAEGHHRALRNIYARVLVMQAVGIEKDVRADSLKMAEARELRDKAELFWESLLLAESSDLLVRFYMAMNLERLGRYDESFSMFEYLLSQSDKRILDLPEILNYYGYSMIDANRTREEVEKGFKLVEEALKLDSSAEANEAYLDSKAWGLYRLGKYEEALSTILLIKGDGFGDDYVYWEHLGAIYAALGKTQEAIKAYKKVLKLNPRHPVANEFLGKKKK